MESKRHTEEEEIGSKKKIEQYIYWGFPMIIAFFILLWFLFEFLFPSNKNIEFQDKFNAIGALFNGLAFAGIICTIILQRKDLDLQRQELKLTREEIKGQKLAAQKQNELFDKQRFENTFFNLLHSYSSFTETFQFNYYLTRHIGMQAFGFMLDCLNNNFWLDINRFDDLFQNLKSKDEEIGREMYSDFSNRYPSLGSYYRLLFRIIKFIDESELNDCEKYQYVSFLRSQLSDSQLILLFYNCTLGYGVDKFKPLVEKWVFFKNLPKERIGDKIDWIDEKSYNRGDRYNK